VDWNDYRSVVVWFFLKLRNIHNKYVHVTLYADDCWLEMTCEGLCVKEEPQHDLPCDDYLMKPFGTDEMLQMWDRAVEMAQKCYMITVKDLWCSFIGKPHRNYTCVEAVTVLLGMGRIDITPDELYEKLGGDKPL